MRRMLRFHHFRTRDCLPIDSHGKIVGEEGAKIIHILDEC